MNIASTKCPSLAQLCCTVLFGLALLLTSRSALAEMLLPLQVDGQTYTAVLNKNTALLTQLQQSGLPQEDNLHYTGHLQGVSDSWLRMSNIDGKWHGIASAFQQIFVLDNSSVLSRNSGQNNGLVSARALDSYDHAEASCGLAESAPRSHFYEDATALPAANSSALKLPQLRSFSELCANKVDDGNGNQLCLIAELEIAFDQQFQSAMGANASSQAVALVNIVDGIYRRNFSVSFETLTLKMLDGSSNVFSTTTSASGLLNDIASKKNNDAIPFVSNKNALFHLVTGRDFDGSTVGVAYLRSLCASGTASGTSQVIGSSSSSLALTALVVAHELGHNFGSPHDGSGNSCGSGFIMGPSLNPSATDFSSCSRSSVESTIGAIEDNRFLAPLNACFNYPVDLAVSAAAGNPTAVTTNQPFTANFILQPTQAAEQIANASFTGSVNGGSIVAANISGQSCTPAANGLSFNCSLTNVTSQTTAAVQLVASAGTLNLSLQTDVSGAQLRDIVASNNALQAQFSASGGGGSDTTPNPFSFTDQSNVAKSQLIVSNAVAISGIDAASNISVSDGEYSIDSGPFTSANGTVSNGNSVRVRHTSASQQLTQTNTVLTVGGVSDTFSSTTAQDVAPPSDSTPAPFTFNDVNNVAAGSLQTSNTITVTGINTAAAISVTNGSYSVNGQAFTSNNATVVNGDSVRVRHNASASPAARTDTTLTIGGISDTFSSITAGIAADNSPDNFAFAPASNVIENSEQITAPITVTGINIATPISISNGEYSINNGAFTSQAGQVTNNDNVRVRHNAASSASTRTDTLLTIGNKTAIFSSTTRAVQVSDTSPPSTSPFPGAGSGGSSAVGFVYLTILLLVGWCRRRRMRTVQTG